MLSTVQMSAAQAALQTAANEADAAEIIWKQKNAARDGFEETWNQTLTARSKNFVQRF